MKTRRWYIVGAILGVVVVLLLADVFGLLGRGGPPPPALPPGSVASVEIALDEVPERQSAFATTSVDAAKIEALAAVVRRARPVDEHRCSESGMLTFHKKDGWTVSLGLLAGHDGRSYEFRARAGVDPGVYRVDRQPLQHALSALGAGPLDPGTPRSK
jgi:hypothetical protein